MLHPILATKLFVPEIRSNFVIRKSLVDKLIYGINTKSKLTLVSAPAGYGKTTLIIELLNSIKMANAWVSLDDSDNDLSQFLSYLIAALKKAGVSIGCNTEEVACDFSLLSTDLPIAMIINDISSLEKETILILDDFHFIHNPQVTRAVKYLLEHQPPDFHLVIITREDPQLPLSRLRVQERLTEIRMGDLCFSKAEAGDFFIRVMGLKLSDKIVETVISRTEGWIAGLQLAGLSLNGYDEKDIEEFITVFSENHRYIIDYLVEEVISHQTEEVRDFLRKTSVLNRMNGELCDAVTSKSNGKLLLKELETMNLFLIPLDAKREWYRYHHLFADTLRAELSKEEELQLHKKAALWLEKNDFRPEAVSHAFKSEDMQLSLRLVEDSMEQAFKGAQLATFMKWLELLPPDLVRGSEILSVRKAWGLLLIGKGSEIASYVDSLGKDFMEKTTPHNKGQLLSLRALFALHEGKADSEILAKEALKYLETWDSMARSATLSTLGRAQEANGKTTEAVQTHRMAYSESLKLGHTFITTLALMNLGMILNVTGRRKEAIELYTEYMDGMISEFGKPLPHIGIIYVGFSELYYESNELDKAKFYVDKGSDLCQSIFFNWFQNSGITEARIRFAMGEREAAINSLKKSLSTIPKDNISDLLFAYISALTELLLRSGNIDEAGQYEERLKCFINSAGNIAGEKARMPYARLLIHQGRKDEALKLLESIKEKTEKRQKFRELITFYILYSKAHYLNRNYEKAASYMDMAKRLAEPQEYRRLFLDEEMAAPGPIPERQEELEGTVGLSQRESEILQLLAKGMSNSEISKTLFISTNTTQWHISHIYSKLGVRSRTQAVLKAGALKIL
jgi:LuxR family maltose regulon positive regulatory protein